jgi:cyclophilin family peptidyl-prolyl cis-trans isomerase
MKNIKSYTLIIFLVVCSTFIVTAQKNTKILIETSLGNLTAELYDQTPFHQENFLKLIGEHYYDGLLFHRVIKDFMIQTGDPDSKDAKPGQLLGRGGPDYTIPAEFVPELYHRKGAIAAARQGDRINPKKESSGSQFYIVEGRKYTDQELDAMEQRNMHIRFTDEQREVYKTLGGTPHLDYSYTVFGQVTDGLNVLDSIANVPTDKNNRPLKDVKIITIKVLK